ncbi:MAG: glutathione peroxidase [Ethanoligenens sp.]|uniref:glutathione peroxidase n=1 Tax=Ethanoligenens sp. TaxID=2099655 RepID=UPI0039ED4887
MSIYDFSAKTLGGKTVALSDYKGKVLLVVNTASKCGFTPQYEGLEALYKANKDKGLEILGFPCNQFLGQEPGNGDEIKSFCKLNYGVTFPLFAKIDVRGPEASPIYDYLKNAAPFQGLDLNVEGARVIEGVLKDKYPELLEGNDIKWNFTKFLINREGEVVGRFEPYIVPADLQVELDKLL